MTRARSAARVRLRLGAEKGVRVGDDGHSHRTVG
jgi:hypothetical protein